MEKSDKRGLSHFNFRKYVAKKVFKSVFKSFSVNPVTFSHNIEETILKSMTMCMGVEYDKIINAIMTAIDNHELNQLSKDHVKELILEAVPKYRPDKTPKPVNYDYKYAPIRKCSKCGNYYILEEGFFKSKGYAYRCKNCYKKSIENKSENQLF